MGEEDFLRGLLRGYYASAEINSVPDIASREFGIGEFGKKISSRHLEFRSPRELNFFLRGRAPFYISYSNAHYDFPSARPMEKKSMRGADLIYEFDADDIPTECKLRHDSWKCTSCSAEGKGNISECPECGSGVKVDEWTCPECIGETKKQSLRLINLLEKDFSFSDGIAVNFSGSKGFHIHVRGENIQALSKAARLELLDYITGMNLDLSSLGFGYRSRTYYCPKKSRARGWAKKIILAMERLFGEGDSAKISALASRGKSNFTKGACEKLLKEKHSIMNGIERGFLLIVPGVNSRAFWDSLLGALAEGEGLMVDRQTSIDINKIIRVPDTIHGSTGLAAKTLPVSSLKNFDAFRECVAFNGGEVKVKDAVSPEFILAGKKFGPYSKEDVSLPDYAAFYLVARGSALTG